MRNEGKCERRGKESDSAAGTGAQTLQEAEKPESSSHSSGVRAPGSLHWAHPAPCSSPGGGETVFTPHLCTRGCSRGRGLPLLVPACLSSKSPQLELNGRGDSKRTCNSPSQVERVALCLPSLVYSPTRQGTVRTYGFADRAITE